MRCYHFFIIKVQVSLINQSKNIYNIRQIIMIVTVCYIFFLQDLDTYLSHYYNGDISMVFLQLSCVSSCKKGHKIDWVYNIGQITTIISSHINEFIINNYYVYKYV